MERGLKWLAYTLLAIVFLVALVKIGFGMYQYRSHNDKSGLFVACAGALFILVEIGILILLFRRVKTT